MLRVLLVDDHAALRDGLGVLLERKGVRVVDAVGSAAAALESVAREQPEVAVVDLDLPDRDGLQLVRELRRGWPAVKVVIYTGSQDGKTLGGALASGAEGIVLKPTGLGVLVDALRAVGRGGRHVDPEIEGLLAVADGDATLLTRREREVFALLARGESGEEIAAQLSLAPETVRTHIRNAMSKLQARTRTEAVVRAVSSGEVDLP